MKAKQVKQILGITSNTLSTYVKQGYIKVIVKPTGRYEYVDDSVYAFIGQKKKQHKKKIVSYSRVSTTNQKTQLKEQTNRIYESCISKGISLDEQIEDIKSGMSFDRPGFQKLCESIIQNKIELIVIENKDRLVRFGYDLFEGLFKYFGCKILVCQMKYKINHMNKNLRMI